MTRRTSSRLASARTAAKSSRPGARSRLDVRRGAPATAGRAARGLGAAQWRVGRDRRDRADSSSRRLMKNGLPGGTRGRVSGERPRSPGPEARSRPVAKASKAGRAARTTAARNASRRSSASVRAPARPTRLLRTQAAGPRAAHPLTAAARAATITWSEQPRRRSRWRSSQHRRRESR
jgi:hypothetical protein